VTQLAEIGTKKHRSERPASRSRSDLGATVALKSLLRFPGFDLSSFADICPTVFVSGDCC
jgi:hypothetical protein